MFKLPKTNKLFYIVYSLLENKDGTPVELAHEVFVLQINISSV